MEVFKERDPWTENRTITKPQESTKSVLNVDKTRTPRNGLSHFTCASVAGEKPSCGPSRRSRLPVGELAHIMHGKEDPTHGWAELCDEQLDLTDCKSGEPCSCLCVGPEVFQSGSRKSPRLRESSRTARITRASFEKHDFATSRSCLTSPC